MKLWDKGYDVDKNVELFTTMEDRELDSILIRYDIVASKAHAKVLHKAGVLNDVELYKILNALDELYHQVQGEDFKLSPEDEDCHTAIENFLISKLGELGKKIHTARSRNDQVLTALRLYYREKMKELKTAVEELISKMKEFSSSYGHIAFAGYTHTRPAMPTDVKTWTEAYINALEDDLKLLESVYEIVDQNPLGTGAGYGVPLNIDRELSTEELGFSRTQRNPIYAQHSRGKFEALILHLLVQIMYDLNRIASDIIFLSLLGCFHLPDEITTGSSIMPQKKNPDVLELIRGYFHRILGYQITVTTTASNLIMGYHRDLQLIKKPMFEAFEISIASLKMMNLTFDKLEVNEKQCLASITEDVMATHRVYELVKKGVPFRDAYRQVARELKGRM